MHALKTPPGASHFACSTLFLGLAVWVLAGTPLSMNAQPKYTIAYSGLAPLNTDIFIADADGRNPKPFLASPALDFNASFSRDGKWIAFTSERNGSADIYRAHVNGTGLEQLTNDPSFDDQAALSPDGRTLAFISTRSRHAELWTLDLPARKLHNITNHAGGHFRPAWIQRQLPKTSVIEPAKLVDLNFGAGERLLRDSISSTLCDERRDRSPDY